MNSRLSSVPVNKAREIISQWSIDDPKEIILANIASDMNLLIIKRRITGAVSMLVCRDNVGLITLRDDIREVGRKRFAIAHEIGHFVLHKGKSPLAVCTDEDFQAWYKHSTDEAEANAFAAEMLMPADLFRERCVGEEPSFTEVIKLAEDFQTSLTATAIRYVELGKHPCALIASKDSRIIWMSVHEDFPYRIIGRGSRLHKYSCANDYFETGSVPEQAEPVSGIAWIEDLKHAKRCSVYEAVIPLKSYNTVLSFIWIEHDANEGEDWEYKNPTYDTNHFTPDGKRYRW